MAHQLRLTIGKSPAGEPPSQGERIMQQIEKMLIQRRADRLRAKRQAGQPEAPRPDLLDA